MAIGKVTLSAAIGMMSIFISLFCVYTHSTVNATAPSTPLKEDDGLALSAIDAENALPAIFDNVSNSVVQIVSITPPLFSLNPQARNTTEVRPGSFMAI